MSISSDSPNSIDHGRSGRLDLSPEVLLLATPSINQPTFTDSIDEVDPVKFSPPSPKAIARLFVVPNMFVPFRSAMSNDMGD